MLRIIKTIVDFISNLFKLLVIKILVRVELNFFFNSIVIILIGDGRFEY